MIRSEVVRMVADTIEVIRDICGEDSTFLIIIAKGLLTIVPEKNPYEYSDSTIMHSGDPDVTDAFNDVYGSNTAIVIKKGIIYDGLSEDSADKKVYKTITEYTRTMLSNYISYFIERVICKEISEVTEILCEDDTKVHEEILVQRFLTITTGESYWGICEFNNEKDYTEIERIECLLPTTTFTTEATRHYQYPLVIFQGYSQPLKLHNNSVIKKILRKAKK